MVEVLVAGAGPAGAVTALVLARAGVRVLLVDRARFPRPKLCGDALNPGAVALLDRLGLASALEARGRRLAGMLVTGGRGRAICGRYEGHHGLAVPRVDLDAYLLDAAGRAGARIQEAVRVVAPMVEESGGRATVRGAVLEANGRRLRVPAGVTVAADGRRSTLGLALGLLRHPAQPRRWAVGAYFAGAGGLADVGEMHIRPGHYIGIAPLPSGLANACLVTADRRGLDRPAALLQARLAADPLLAERFAGAAPVTPVVSVGPLAVDASRVAVPGLLLVGDAAGFVDPLTGDGLRFAIRGAMLAADAILRSLSRPALRPDRWFGARVRREFASKRRFNRALRALVGSERGLCLGALGAAVAPAIVRRLIEIAGDVPGRRAA